MKKFVFQLEALYKVKKSQGDRLQTEYAEAEAFLENALEKKEKLEKALEYESEKYEEKAKKGLTVSEIQIRGAFLDELGRQYKRAVTEAERARHDAERKREELLAVFREIKTLEKLREKQHEEYIAEEERRETDIIEDIISFEVSEKGLNQRAL